MKNTLKYFTLLLVATAVFFNGCGQFNFPTDFPIGNQPNTGLTNADIVQGLKEALSVGAQNSVNVASKTDGFFRNSELFIPFPEEAIKVKNTLESAGIKKPVDDFVLSLNRAAEDAAQRAFPIFKNAIISMTITDAMGILKGNDNAATEYLKAKTTSQLKAEFQPIVRQSISNVKVTSYWNPLVTNYNRLTVFTGSEQVNPNLEDYITTKAIDGLFILVAKEEALIRKDPAARVTDILRKVFGN
jgi:hypothetical protein